ncbi:hypothetical protein CVU82_03075 [Candidatus Falkowbacteria bacterium HGW-Falkowbacteria-1]|uniref:O-antigen ligase-related domain-containing protein n=1 Tax=Candidatus Falkowbacteria bacterium HGW-Falkowbacteria-1 TaxID=2013768 RepID=A0A2N2EA52_9BACT|nr:MAG: hypothetical protein CVU82_03075 [Candidatus Falkowbacteria bacterium HGW-Falkowbacteria-1]
MKNKIEKIIEYLFYIFVFVLPFQTKYILFSAETNYNEIAIFLNYLILAILVVVFFLYFFKYRKISSDFDIPKHYLVLIGLDLFIFVSIFVSSFFDLSLFRYFLFLLAIALFFIVLNFKFNFKKLIVIFIFSIFLQSIIGLGQFFIQKTFSNKYLGISVHDPSVLGVSVLEGDFGRLVRSYGGQDHPNIFAALVFFALIFCLLLVFKFKFKFWQKIILYSVYFILLLSLLTSFSRSAWMAFVLSMFLIFILLLFENKKENLKKYLPIFSFSLFFLILFFTIFKPFILNRFNLNSRLEIISNSERVEQIYSSSDIIKSNLWLGVGYGAYHQKLLSLNPDLKSYQAQPVHNVFLLVLSEIGIWGFIFFVWFLGHSFMKSAKGPYYFINFSLFLGIFIFMIFDHWLWSLPFGLLVLFFILSLSYLNGFKDFYNENT